MTIGLITISAIPALNYRTRHNRKAQPFPVLVQRSWNNSDPELDAIRRQLVVKVLTDLGNTDADQRTVVSQPYTEGINSIEGEQDHGRVRRSRLFAGLGGGGAGGGGF